MTFIDALKTYRFHLALAVPVLVGLYYSIVPDMVRQWASDDNYSHGFLVPLISAFFVYQRWDRLRDERVEPSNIGLIVIFIGLSTCASPWWCCSAA